MENPPNAWPDISVRIHQREIPANQSGGLPPGDFPDFLHAAGEQEERNRREWE